MIKYEIKKGKYVFCKDGVYIALTEDQIDEMEQLFDVIKHRAAEKQIAALQQLKRP